MAICSGLPCRLRGWTLGAMLAFVGLVPDSSALAQGFDTTRHDLTLEEQEERYAFVFGNSFFILLHEFGHALINEFSIPVLGREEDAVDNLATVLLVPDEPDPEIDQILIDAIDGWFMSDDYYADQGEELAVWGEHALDAQRAYQITCLVYGSDPEGFSDLADSTDLPDYRRDSCIDTWDQTERSWMRVLEPHIRGTGDPKPKVNVFYGPAQSDSEEEMRQILQETKMLETFASDLMAEFKLPRTLTVAAEACGEENAYWIPSEGRIVLCYELMTFYDDMIYWDIKDR